MPLLSGTSDAAIHENIRELMHAGHPQDQAIAAAYAHARRQKDGARHLKTAKRPSLSPSHPFNGRKAPANRRLAGTALPTPSDVPETTAEKGDQ